MSNHVIESKKPLPVELNRIKAIVGQDIIEKTYPAYLVDESKKDIGIADQLYFPKTVDEVSTIFRELQARKQAITISGARTGIVGGCIPLGGTVVSLEKMNSITGIRYDMDSDSWFIKCQAGVTLIELAEAVMKKNLKLTDEYNEVMEKFKEEREFIYPVDPTEMTASIGGTVATNASGARTFKYGATREWVTWIQIVLANGEILEITRGKHFASTEGKFIIKTSNRESELMVPVPNYRNYPVDVKNAAGIFGKPLMDIIDLFIGSEGILGVITEVEVRLKKKTNTVSVTQFFDSEIKALKFVIDIRQKDGGIDTEYLEFMDGKSLDLLRKKQGEDPKFIDMPTIPPTARSAIFFDIDNTDDSLIRNKEKLVKLVTKHGSSIDWSWAGYEEREKARFKHFRHSLPEIVNNIIAERKNKYPEIHKLGTDLAVPDQALLEMYQFYKDELDSRGYEYVIFGHIGDNHPHINILPKDLDELKGVMEFYKTFAKKAVSLGGTVSAEHGIGKIKKDYLRIMFQEDLSEMIKVKKALDPDLMINKGSLFDLEG
ncbi:MAG: FAD-binding oxidoreductase [Candidatus Hodarchaeales archaeon]